MNSDKFALYMYGLMAVIVGSVTVGDYGWPKYYSQCAHGFTGCVAVILCWAVLGLKSGIEQRDEQAEREFGLVYNNLLGGYELITDIQARDDKHKQRMEDEASRASRLKNRQAGEESDD